MQSARRREFLKAAAASLVGWDRRKVEVQIDWPDGNNDVRDNSRVRVQLSGRYRPMMSFVFGNREMTLSADSIMHVAH